MIDYWRQLGILPPRDMAGQSITVIGVGGIGSPTVLALAKMGIPEIIIYDEDVVDNHNLPNQLYRKKDVGRPKVEALQEIVAEYSDTKIVPNRCNFTEKSRAKGIVVSAVHSMTGRQAIWQAIRYNIHVPIYIDSRMGAEVLRMFSLKPTDSTLVRWYEKSLHSDEKAYQAPCTERAIIYTVFFAAGLISSQVKKYIMGQDYLNEVNLDIKNILLVVE